MNKNTIKTEIMDYIESNFKDFNTEIEFGYDITEPFDNSTPQIMFDYPKVFLTLYHKTDKYCDALKASTFADGKTDFEIIKSLLKEAKYMIKNIDKYTV